MSLINIPLKYIKANKLRSASLGLFILISTLIFMIFNSLVDTIQINMQDVITRAMTGEVQLRPGTTEEEEMVSFSSLWDELEFFKPEKANELLDGLKDIDKIRYEERLRGSGVFIKNTLQAASLFIGIDHDSSVYKQAISLKKGRFLNSADEKAAVISSNLANQLDVDLGDKIDLMVNANGKGNGIKLEVVGIGDLTLMKMFGIEPVYINMEAAQELMGYEKGSVTDILVYSKDNEDANKLLERINESLQLEENTSVKTSVWRDVAGTIMGGINLYVAMFYSFLVILLIISAFLITNMVFMMGIERRRDIGTLKAIGFGKFRIVSLFVTEVVIISVVFNIIGVGLGLVANHLLANTVLHVGAPLNFVFGDDFTLKYNPMLSIPIFFTMVVYSVIVSLYPSYKLALQNPSDTIRES